MSCILHRCKDTQKDQNFSYLISGILPYRMFKPTFQPFRTKSQSTKSPIQPHKGLFLPKIMRNLTSITNTHSEYEKQIQSQSVDRPRFVPVCRFGFHHGIRDQLHHAALYRPSLRSGRLGAIQQINSPFLGRHPHGGRSCADRPAHPAHHPSPPSDFSIFHIAHPQQDFQTHCLCVAHTPAFGDHHTVDICQLPIFIKASFIRLRNFFRIKVSLKVPFFLYLCPETNLSKR